MIDYNKSVTQLWTVIAGLFLDSTPIASNILNSYIRYTYDEFIPIPMLCDSEVSPYTFEEKLNVSTKGENRGATYDDLNILTTTAALKTARLIGGIDDSDSMELKFIPRLPEKWKKLHSRNISNFRPTWPTGRNLRSIQESSRVKADLISGLRPILTS